MNKLELKALAKINLGLDVIGQRDNGYHDVRMVMQTIYLYDNISIRITREPGIKLETNLSFLPTNEANIAYRAAQLLIDEFRIRNGVSIALEKHIPVSAGLAGGSANAAAILFGMNQMFRLGLGQKALMRRGVTLGADVPYCLMRGTVLAEGIGELLTPLPPMPRCYVLIAKPSVSVSTKSVYEKLDSQKVVKHPDIDGVINGLKRQDLNEIAQAMGNILECVTIQDYPIIAQLKDTMFKCGALGSMMSGSGPTVFGIFDDRTKAKQAWQILKRQRMAKLVYLTTIHSVRGREGQDGC